MPSSRLQRIATDIEAWFATSQRDLPWRRTYAPYHVWVSEVMLQQTRMEVVQRYFTGFIARFPDVRALAAADDDAILGAWSGLGYYRRATMLRDGARDVSQRFAGELPRSVEELMSIRGIGRYTAGAIASIAFGGRAPIVDGNVARIVSRLQGIDAPIGSPALMRAAWSEAEHLVARCSAPRDFNQGLMEIGALICTPRAPRCDTCPLKRHCIARATERVDLLPAPRVKASAERITVPLYLIEDDRGRILMQRGDGTLMHSMLHLPHGNERLLGTQPLEVAETRLIGTFRHAITTRRINFQLYSAALAMSVRETPTVYEWVHPDSLSWLPHPSYVTKALRLAGSRSV